MTTFDFIDLEDRDTGAWRTIFVRGDVNGMRSTRHLDRIMQARGLRVLAIHRCEAETLAKAIDRLSCWKKIVRKNWEI